MFFKCHWRMNSSLTSVGFILLQTIVRIIDTIRKAVVVVVRVEAICVVESVAIFNFSSDILSLNAYYFFLCRCWRAFILGIRLGMFSWRSWILIYVCFFLIYRAVFKKNSFINGFRPVLKFRAHFLTASFPISINSLFFLLCRSALVFYFIF